MSTPLAVVTASRTPTCVPTHRTAQGTRGCSRICHPSRELCEAFPCHFSLNRNPPPAGSLTCIWCLTHLEV